MGESTLISYAGKLTREQLLLCRRRQEPQPIGSFRMPKSSLARSKPWDTGRAPRFGGGR